MTILHGHDQASFETIKRLLAELVNEGLVQAEVEVSSLGLPQVLCLLTERSSVKVGIKPGTIIKTRHNRVVTIVRPDDLQAPVTVENVGLELDPGTLFEYVSPSFGDLASQTTFNEIIGELRNSASNQEKWLEIGKLQPLLSLQDQLIDWERTLIHGHPSHPYHRLCYAQSPLKPVSPEDIPGMLQPTLAFVSVPREDLRITGNFEKELQPLLNRLEVPEPTTTDRVTVPCLSQQLPSIRQRFPKASVVKLVSDCVDAQASMRTLTVKPGLGFRYNLKLSLACHITSALRTITPWTTCSGPILTEILEKFLPHEMWVFREVASVSGSQDNFNDARHLSCILRNSLESRAHENDETLIIASALAQKPHGDSRTYAEVLFNLNKISEKTEWFQRYVTRLFELVLHPLANYGIGLEAHGQNLVARICRRTADIKGFAIRDFGGVRMHVPTLEAHGVKFDGLPPGAATLTDNLHNVWSKVHHSLLQNHVGVLLGSLGLENHGGWTIVLNTLSSVLKPDQGAPGQGLFDFLTKDTMPFKCFLRMRMEGKYRDYVERDVPNVLLMDSLRWESLLDAYQPSLHAT